LVSNSVHLRSDVGPKEKRGEGRKRGIKLIPKMVTVAEEKDDFQKGKGNLGEPL